MKGKGKGIKGDCWNCGKSGHRSSDCWAIKEVATETAAQAVEVGGIFELACIEKSCRDSCCLKKKGRSSLGENSEYPNQTSEFGVF